MKVKIYGGEAFPTYSVESMLGESVEVDLETLKRWKKVSLDYEQMQKEIIEVLKAQDLDYYAGNRIPCLFDFDLEGGGDG